MLGKRVLEKIHFTSTPYNPILGQYLTWLGDVNFMCHMSTSARNCQYLIN